jgi:hypothetical protein
MQMSRWPETGRSRESGSTSIPLMNQRRAFGVAIRESLILENASRADAPVYDKGAAGKVAGHPMADRNNNVEERVG